jgi:hypothetical protein
MLCECTLGVEKNNKPWCENFNNSMSSYQCHSMQIASVYIQTNENNDINVGACIKILVGINKKK